MFIQTEATPNPATLKFLPGEDVLGQGAMDFTSPEAAKASPLAERLFAIDGVTGVFLGADFISATKAEGLDWAQLKAPILSAIMEHYTKGLPILADGGAAASEGGSAEGYEGEDAEIVEQIIDLIETRVRPAVAADGGDIIFDRYSPDDGTVFLHMRGACAGCPASSMTLKSGIENMLRHYIPEVNAVEAVL